MLIALVLAAAAPAFDPMLFFAGETRGEGRLKILFHAREVVSVRGTGRVGADGGLVLDQVVHEGQKPARARQWRLHQTAPGHYEGTLTDATSPVIGEVEGVRLHLTFTSRGGFAVQQWLSLSANGRSASNRLEARRLGVIVAVLDETITRAD